MSNSFSKMKFNDIQELHSDMALDKKIQLIQRHVEINHFGHRNIPCCMPYDGGITGAVRSWKVADFEGQSVASFRCNRPGKSVEVTPADHFNNENSTSLSGEYLLSQVYRYEFTREQKAWDECDRALEALQAIAALSGPRKFGWLCKPFSEKVSMESSPDQNVCALAGLWAFLPHARPKQASWIRRIIPSIARYWEALHYTIDFSDHVWDIRSDVAHMRIFWMANLLAFKVTGQREFAKVARRLENQYGRLQSRSVSLFDAHRESKPGYFSDWRIAGEFAGATLLFAPLMLNILCELQPERKSEYLRAFRRALEHGTIGLDPTWYGHFFFHEVKTCGDEYIWRPAQGGQPDPVARYRMSWGRWAIYEYPHRLLWMDATARLPSAYLLYRKCGGTALPNIERMVREIMARLDFVRLHWWVDPHHDQTAPELEHTRHALSSEVCNYLTAYWLGRSLKYWIVSDGMATM